MVDITIDKITHCLELRGSEPVQRVNTVYRKLRITKTLQKELKREGWNFDWLKSQSDGNVVYALYAENDERIQGLVSFHYVKAEAYVFIALVESAPWNIGHDGYYAGVGAHLFAIACKEGWDHHYFYFMFESKSDLVEHYVKQLHAEVITYGIPPRLVLNPEAAADLINFYLLKEAENEGE